MMTYGRSAFSISGMRMAALTQLSLHVASPSASSPPQIAQAASPFSELSLFLFGSGFALFVALLGWSDQIRGLAKEIRELESEFLQKYNLSRGELIPAIIAKTPDEQLEALTVVMQSRKLSTVSSVRMLPLLREWHRVTDVLTLLQSWKYNLTIALSLICFVAGGLAAAHCDAMLLLIVPALLLTAIFALIIVVNFYESRLRKTLADMSE